MKKVLWAIIMFLCGYLLAENYASAAECCCTQKVVYKTKWKTKVVYVDKVVEKPVYITKTVVQTEYLDYNTSALNLLVENSPTNNHTYLSGNTVYSEQKRETSLGLQYQHDFGIVRTSLGIIGNGAVLGGLGIVF